MNDIFIFNGLDFSDALLRSLAFLWAANALLRPWFKPKPPRPGRVLLRIGRPPGRGA